MSLKSWFIQKAIEREGKKMLEKLEGKRTFITLGIAVLLGAIETYNLYCGIPSNMCKVFDIPPFIYSFLAGIGIYTRAIAKPK